MSERRVGGKKAAIATSKPGYVKIIGRKVHIGYLIGIVFLAVIIVPASKKTIQNLRLAKNGVFELGIVTTKYKVGGKGTFRINYEFKVENQTYTGFANDEDYQEGDSIEVVYLRSDPAVNRAYRFIIRNYSVSKVRQ
ncbi:hypothetical protein [Chitinophaga rhizosphaerae]|uniref:hypothetical protein n=1 Tax=Chitinophaga rhizosphaerae TaxID=1864947 RepID=UPI000F805822|nr:hypothetical protein [Chitinophaga rhizosphaerae]